MSLEVTVRDTETGDTETRTIDGDYVLVCDRPYFLHYISRSPTTGTVVLTVKMMKIRVEEDG